MIKVVAPTMSCRVINRAMQAVGGAGITDDFGLAAAYTTARYLRLADGPDEVHHHQVARLELRRYRDAARTGGGAAVLDPDSAERAAHPTWSRYREEPAPFPGLEPLMNFGAGVMTMSRSRTAASDPCVRRYARAHSHRRQIRPAHRHRWHARRPR